MQSGAGERRAGEGPNLQPAADGGARSGADLSATADRELQLLAAERDMIRRYQVIRSGAGVHPCLIDRALDLDLVRWLERLADRQGKGRGDVADRDGAAEVLSDRDGEVVA